MTGELISLGVAIFWTASAVCFEYAGRVAKSTTLNLIKLVFSLIAIGTIIFFMAGSPFPKWADSKVWLWMSLSGFSGFVFGDFFLFAAYRMIPARITQLIMTISPLFAALAAYILLGETLAPKAFSGMILTISGIAISILKRSSKNNPQPVVTSPAMAANYSMVTKAAESIEEEATTANSPSAHGHHASVELSIPWKGVVFSVFAAIGQGVGLVLSKMGMLEYGGSISAASDSFSSASGSATLPAAMTNPLYTPLAATEIRVIIGVICFAVIIALSKGGFSNIPKAFSSKKYATATICGSISGPLVGVVLSMMAVFYTDAAIASTIIAIVPILIIIPDRFIYKRRVTLIEILGAFISVTGVALFFI
ncbi:MAG: DMT family transporter [Bacteroidales bacterium]|nr:DMT family transporter [Bacteroidales bacterium]MDD4670126.1 DMT family transporter [Bacteroidales bacterium]